MNFGRKILRDKAKKSYKNFIKENKEYRNISFNSFYTLYKAGMFRRHDRTEQPKVDNSEISDMLVEDLQEQ